MVSKKVYMGTTAVLLMGVVLFATLGPGFYPEVEPGFFAFACANLTTEYYWGVVDMEIVEKNYTMLDGNFTPPQNVTVFYNQTVNIYGWINETPYCLVENLLLATSDGILDYDGTEFTLFISADNQSAVVKDIARGGSWQDDNLGECWNPGVPCVILNSSAEITFSYEDSDKILKQPRYKE